MKTDQLDLEPYIQIPVDKLSNIDMGFCSKRENQDLKKCLKCNKLHNQNNFTFIPYDDIIQQYELNKPDQLKQKQINNSINQQIYDTPSKIPNGKQYIKVLLCPKDKLQNVGSSNSKNGFVGDTYNPKDDSIIASVTVRHKYDDIPYMIRRELPKLKPTDYEKYKNDSRFRSMKSVVCYDCYFECMQFKYEIPRIKFPINTRRSISNVKSNHTIMTQPDLNLYERIGYMNKGIKPPKDRESTKSKYESTAKMTDPNLDFSNIEKLRSKSVSKCEIKAKSATVKENILDSQTS